MEEVFEFRKIIQEECGKIVKLNSSLEIDI